VSHNEGTSAAAARAANEVTMKLSTDRILTTHVGSLPRSTAVVDFLYKKENGEQYDPAAFAAAMQAGVAEAVAKQRAAGIDVHQRRRDQQGRLRHVHQGPSVRLRGPRAAPAAPSISRPNPELREAMARMMGKQSFKRAACVGPIELIDRDAMKTDVANLNAAIATHRPVEAFMNAASPGVISSFQSNSYYRHTRRMSTRSARP